MSKRYPAFTLVEMLVVIGIMALMFTFGFVNFFQYRERLEIENAASKLQVFINQVQTYARNGNRGAKGTACNPNSGNLYDVSLKSWTMEINPSAKTFTAYPTCTVSGAATSGKNTTAAITFTLPENLTLTIRSIDNFYTTVTINFASVYGGVTFDHSLDSLELIIGEPDSSQPYYHFWLKSSGVVTTGCFCNDPNKCESNRDEC